jgi:hypothetical protein
MSGPDQRTEKQKMLAGDLYRAVGDELATDSLRADRFMRAYVAREGVGVALHAGGGGLKGWQLPEEPAPSGAVLCSSATTREPKPMDIYQAPYAWVMPADYGHLEQLV